MLNLKNPIFRLVWDVMVSNDSGCWRGGFICQLNPLNDSGLILDVEQLCTLSRVLEVPLHLHKAMVLSEQEYEVYHLSVEMGLGAQTSHKGRPQSLTVGLGVLPEKLEEEVGQRIVTATLLQAKRVRWILV